VPSRYEGKASADALWAGKVSTEEGTFWFSVSTRRGKKWIAVRNSKSVDLLFDVPRGKVKSSVCLHFYALGSVFLPGGEKKARVNQQPPGHHGGGEYVVKKHFFQCNSKEKKSSNATWEEWVVTKYICFLRCFERISSFWNEVFSVLKELFITIGQFQNTYC
jgi:hypothetical protein